MASRDSHSCTPQCETLSQSWKGWWWEVPHWEECYKKHSLLLLHMNYISLGPKQSLFVSSVLKEGWAMHCKGRDLSEWVEECDLWDCPQLSPVVADRACLFSPQGKTFPFTAQHSQLIFANPMRSIRYKITLTIQQGCFILKNFPLSCII